MEGAGAGIVGVATYDKWNMIGINSQDTVVMSLLPPCDFIWKVHFSSLLIRYTSSSHLPLSLSSYYNVTYPSDSGKIPRSSSILHKNRRYIANYQDIYSKFEFFSSAFLVGGGAGPADILARRSLLTSRLNGHLEGPGGTCVDDSQIKNEPWKR